MRKSCQIEGATPETKTKNQNKKMETTYYILKAKDCFGDLWPLSNITSGIDGRHETMESAKKSADRFATEKDFRRSLREQNGWEKNSIRGLEIMEVALS